MDTIVSRLLQFAESQPEAVAFVEKGQRLTYGGLGRRVRATAAWLHRAGVEAGDVVALSFEPPLTASLRSLQFFYALASLGAVVLPLYPEVPAAAARPGSPTPMSPTRRPARRSFTTAGSIPVTWVPSTVRAGYRSTDGVTTSSTSGVPRGCRSRSSRFRASFAAPTARSSVVGCSRSTS